MDSPSPEKPEPASGAFSASPMMAQYIEIKAANPDCLLFYRMGDFYEMFFEDAEIAVAGARHRPHQARQASGPRHPDVRRADPRRRRVPPEADRPRSPRRGLRADRGPGRGEEARLQVGRPPRRDPPRYAAARSPRTRSSRRGRNNYLAAVSRCAARAATAPTPSASPGSTSRPASSGCATSERRGLPPNSPVSIRASCWSPSRSFPTQRSTAFWRGLGPAVTPLSPAFFDGATAAARLAEYFAVRTLDGFGAFSRAELAAAAAALAYVEKTQMGERPPLSPPAAEAAGAAMLIDAATRANLELTATLSGDRRGSLLARDRPHRHRRRRAPPGAAASPAPRPIPPRSTAGSTAVALAPRRRHAAGLRSARRSPPPPTSPARCRG